VSGILTPNQLIKDLANGLRNFVSPLYVADKHGRPTLIGSGVLMQINQKRFLLTAGHVLDWNKDTTFYAPDDDNTLIELTSPSGTKIVPPQHDRIHDHLDVAFIELETKYFTGLSSYKFLEIVNANGNDAPNTRKLYGFIGYPSSKAKARTDISKVRPIPFLYYSRSIDHREYEQLGFSPRSHVIIRFDPEKVRSSDGNVHRFPSPYGMSGGGVWLLADLSGPLKAESFEPTLVGIATEYHKDEGILVSTKLSVLFEMLRAAYPELSDTIPASTLIRVSANLESKDI